ncbi:MAG: HEPN domain-containing protein [Candidatus Thermoplasmatota archaeon]|nr:HEPN domain-containing protein [Candidatus Thermoplasmatota archaeon]
MQSYYSMFHAAKALVLKRGYREKSHFCLIIALRELYVKEEQLNAEMVENLELCMNLRHEADYGLTYHQESAETAIKYAEEFLDNALKLL